MDKDFALKLAVIVSITGLIMLFIVSKFITIEPVGIGSVDERLVGKTVLVKGEITKISSSERAVIYVDNNPLPLVAFSNIELEKNTNVLITGRVDEYKDGLQVIIDKIEVVK